MALCLIALSLSLSLSLSEPVTGASRFWSQLYATILSWGRAVAPVGVDVENEAAEAVFAAWRVFDRKNASPTFIRRWAWLVLRRRLISAYRRDRKHQVFDARQHGVLVCETEKRLAVREALDLLRCRLPERERCVLDLLRLGVTSNAEIAHVARSSLEGVGSAKRVLRSALCELRGDLGAHGHR